MTMTNEEIEKQIVAITRSLDSISTTIQLNQQAMKSQLLAVRALADCCPDKAALYVRYQALLKFHQGETGEALQNVLN